MPAHQLPARQRRAVLAVVFAMLVSVLPAAAQSRPAATGDAAATATDPDAVLTSGLEALGQLGDGARAALDSALQLVQPTGHTVRLGPDRRLTVLLLGSDKRPGYPENLDVILVVSLDPDTGRVAAASIPRDTVRFPRARGGTSGSTRVNAMFRGYLSSCSKSCALNRFRNDVARALGIKIDYYAYLRFGGFDALIDHVNGVKVSTPRIIDKGYMDEPTLPKGIRFPARTGYELRGVTTPYCKSWKASAASCHRALVWVRSRKGSEGGRANSDFRRAYRQQRLVMAAVKRVLQRGPGSLGALRNATSTRITTDLPQSLANAQHLYNMLNGSRLAAKVVFAPSIWAYHTSGMPAYTFALRLSRVRAWINQKMPPS